MGLKDGGGTMTMPDTEDYIVFDRTGTPHVVVAVKTEMAGIARKAEIGRWRKVSEKYSVQYAVTITVAYQVNENPWSDPSHGRCYL